MTKLLHKFSEEYGAEDRGLISRILPSLHVDPVEGLLVPYYSANMSYRDVISMTGLSWSNMLKETSASEIRQFSSQSARRPSSEIYYHQRDELPRVVIKKAPYHWTRTENLTPKIQATDRPYRNTYGDGTSSPSKLHLSTELPDLDNDSATSSANGGNKPSLDAKKWPSNKQIAKIYNLLHSGDARKLNKLHVYKKKGRYETSLPTVLPHFYLQLNDSINKVLKEEEIQPEVVFTRRPMTSERITYKPIMEKSSNPELIVSKTGSLEFRFKRRSNDLQEASTRAPGNDLSPRNAVLTAVNVAPIISQLPNKPKPLPRVMTHQKQQVDRECHQQIRKRIFPTKYSPRQQQRKTTPPPPSMHSSLQSADGFPLTVKITPKTHPNKEKSSSSINIVR